MKSDEGTRADVIGRTRWWWLPLVLFLVLLAVFVRNILPGHILFSNDGPLGANSTHAMAMPSAFRAVWNDLNAIGNYAGNVFLPVTGTLLWILGPVFFAKIYAASILLLLGCSAGFFFHQLRLARGACLLGGLAAALNSTFFSSACWGVAAHEVAIAMSFLAMAAVVGGKGWIRLVLAGLAVGVGVMEAADVGAIFSLYSALFIFYGSVRQDGPAGPNIARGIGRVALVAVFALIIAAHSLTTLISTQIKGVAFTQQDTQTKQERWDFATQWSLPKREALGFVVPGLFGYRMDTPEGGVYWGAVGRDPTWYHWLENGRQGPEPSPRGFSGGGIYAGVLVVMVALWAALQSFRKKDSVFNVPERRMLWFWVGVVVISLPLAFGRFAPFYQFLYALPYFSTIRNPGKFLFPSSMALVILFAYGVHGLWRRYMEAAAGAAPYAGIVPTFKTWWQRVRGFDRRWTVWCFAALAGCVLGWLIYASSRQSLEAYLQEIKFDPTMASAIASFSFAQVGWFVLTLAAALVVMTMVLSGVFRGPRAKWGAVFLGLFVVLDLGRANQPWIIVWDYKHKYASNPVIEMLRQKPYEHRVAILPKWLPQVFNLPPQVANAEQIINYLYGIEWSQHLFLYNNIQSLDVIQMPRMPEDLMAYDMAFTPRSAAQLSRVGRKWELTNTRYLIGASELLDLLNQAIDPVQHRFRYAERFTITGKPGFERSNNAQDWTAVPDTNGPFAVFDFTGVLPRAKLYSNWQLEPGESAATSELQTNGLGPGDLDVLKHAGTNGFVTLRKLASPLFDPARTVVVGQPFNTLPSGTNSAADPGKVEFTSYAPKDIAFRAEATAPSILLLNDRYDPNWRVLVDGKADTLLRCNYLMRGVYLTPGTHTVEFKFEPPMGSFYVSLAAVALGILLCGFLLVRGKAPTTEPEPAPQQKPQGAKR